MSNEDSNSLLVRRQTKTSTDKQSRSVPAEQTETAELELMSTMMLKKILLDDDAGNRASIEKAAADPKEGVLARNPSNGQFEIIPEAELKAIFDSNPDLQPVSERPVAVSKPPVAVSEPPVAVIAPTQSQLDQTVENLALVNTQALRRLLVDDTEKADLPVKDVGGGFDPYNNS